MLWSKEKDRVSRRPAAASLGSSIIIRYCQLGCVKRGLSVECRKVAVTYLTTEELGNLGNEQSATTGHRQPNGDGLQERQTIPNPV